MTRHDTATVKKTKAKGGKPKDKTTGQNEGERQGRQADKPTSRRKIG